MQSDFTNYWSEQRKLAKQSDKKYISPYAIAEVGQTDDLVSQNALLKPFRLFVMKKFTQYLYDIGVLWWMSDGTLLGWWREKKMIAHDIDCDIAINEKDMLKVWQNREKINKHLVISCEDTVTGKPWCTDELCYKFDPTIENAKKFIVHMKNPPTPEQLNVENPIAWDVALDVYTYRNEDEILYNNYNKGGLDWRIKPFPREVIYPVMQCSFEGMLAYAPQKTEKWLKINYGYIGKDAYWDEETKKYKKID